MFVLMLFFNAVFAAADPWVRPMHVRVVPEPPSSWSEAMSTTVRHRIWWDATESTAEIQLQTPHGWKRMAKEARSGWTSKPLSRGAVFRVFINGKSLRWSPPAASRNWVSPLDWVGMSGDGLLGPVVSELAFEPASSGRTGRVWGAGMRGGLVEIDEQGHLIKIWREYDGLPDDQVISVDASAGKLLVGTANGALLIDGLQPFRVWDSRLADPYVQSVRFNGDDLWLGTFRGLNRIRSNLVQTLLQPLSVFSLEPAANNGMWVGYNQTLSHYDASDSLSQIDWPKKVYDIIDDGRNRYISSQGFGILRLDGKAHVLNKNWGYSLALGPEGLWAARGGSGLLRPDGQLEPFGASVWSVGRRNNRLWIGAEGSLSSHHIAADLSLTSRSHVASVAGHVDRAIHDLLERPNGAVLCGPDGVWAYGDPHPHVSKLSKAISEETLRLFEYQNSVWALTAKEIFKLASDGTVSRYALPAIAKDGVMWFKRFWISTQAGIFRFDPEQTAFEKVHHGLVLSGLSSGRYGLMGVESEYSIHQVMTQSSNRHAVDKGVLSVAPSGMAACVGSKDGLWRFWPNRKNVAEQFEDPMGQFDQSVNITAVAGDGKGGCWFADEHGSVGLVNSKDQQLLWRLPPDAPKINRLIPRSDGRLWVLSEGGVYLLDTGLAF